MASCLSQASLEAGPLWQYQLSGVVDTGEIVANGTYATVKELEFRGLKCAGKKINGILFGSELQEKAAILQRLAEECKLLSSLHHPCLVQFLGIHFEYDSQLPVLVMEHLSTTLSACLDKCGVLPEDASYRVLHDVALGLRYLHEHVPPVVHRCFSANNVLLTPSMNAKISDIGMANIVNMTPAQMAQKMSTHASGSLCYMSPEALMSQPAYTSKVDSYSYGVMIIHVLCGRWPIPTDVSHHDCKNTDSDMQAPISEIDRRVEYLRDIDQAHPLMGLISQCLNKTPTHRPSASEILHRIDTIIPTIPETNHKMESLQHLVGRIQSQQTEIEAKQSQIESLTSQTRARQFEVEALRTKVRRLSMQIPQTENSDKASARQSWPRPHPPMRRTQSQPNILHPQAKLQWKPVGSLPVGMNRPQVVVVGDKIYVGGGSTDSRADSYLVFQYNSVGGEWTTLPPCPVRYFGLGQLSGELLTVGGVKHSAIVFGKISGKVYRYKPASKKWKKSLHPMPTARFCLCVVSSESALTACGGTTGFSDNKPILSTSVEVYTTETSQWHTTDPLPIPCDTMSSTTISGAAYLLGRFTTDSTPTKTLVYAPVIPLIKKAVSQPQQPASAATQSDSASSAWKTLQDTPLYGSAAVNLGGTLLTIGGRDDNKTKSPSIYIYIPATNSWKRMESGDLPELRYDCSAVDLSANRLLVIGGRDENSKITNTVFLGLLKFGF